MRHLADLPVLLLGLGASGLAMARWCAGHGARLRIWDSRLDGAGRATGPAAEALAPRIDELRSAHPQVEFIGGALDTPAAADTALAGVRLLLKSPGLAPHDARIAALVERARATGLPLQGELELFSRALADLKAERRYAPRVVAITGTNGKTTTTSMAALLIERAGRRVATAGNIGPTMLDTLAEALAREPVAEAEAAEGGAAEAPGIEAAAGAVEDAVADAGDAGETAGVEAGSNDGASNEGKPDGADPIEAAADEGPAPARVPPPPPAPVFEHLPEVWVLELSSFQLDGVQGFEPDAAAVLNLTQDHLDWHGSMEAYAEAKGRIWGRQAVMVINRDDPAVRALAAALQPAPLKAGARSRGPKPVPRRELRFGLEAPQRPGDYGLVVEGGMAWLVRAHEADETLALRRRGAAAEPQEIHLQRLMPADALRVRGRHNASNALAALALAGAIGCPLAPMLHGLREYRGEPHRVEYIATIDQVEAYDDSKGTNVGATVAAIDGLGADRAPARLVLLLGGDGKGQDFSPLVEPLRRHARAIATLGRDAAAIEAVLQAGLESELADGRLPLQRHDTLEAATRWAFGQARAGDAVLLSPACASLDMFRDYAHRSAVFVDALHELQMAHGETA